MQWIDHCKLPLNNIGFRNTYNLYVYSIDLPLHLYTSHDDDIVKDQRRSNICNIPSLPMTKIKHKKDHEDV